MTDTFSRGAIDIEAERRRQVRDERWTPEHDDEHAQGELALTAAVLACDSTGAHVVATVDGCPDSPPLWARQLRNKHAKDRRRQLVIAGALVAAEVDRLDRKAGRA